ncbi:PH domain-containing protein [Candidatus Dojkabacteria bacterium]|nr:PH domain-containing protein [Candidatus Dojkabacteria bacterium]
MPVRRPVVEREAAQRSVITRILPKREVQAFGSIEVYPKKVRFRTQNPGEKVYLLVRAHVITNIGWIIRVAILSAMPIFAFSIFNYLRIEFGFFSEEYVILVLFAYYISVVASALMNLLSWYYNIYLVTSERVLQYEFRPLLAYKVSEAEIENIQDVSQVSIGFFPNIFGYGDIRVQTAANKSRFFFRAVPKPVWFRNVIADLSSLVRAYEP